MSRLPPREQQIVQAHAGLIHRMVLACQDRSQVPDLEEVLDQAVRNGWDDLVAVLRRILDGRRDEGVLEGLDDEDRTVAKTILMGLQDPSVLPDPSAGADPGVAAPGIASLVHAAGTGDPQALQWAAEMAEQMQRAGGEMAGLAGIIRPLINGERDPEFLTRGMGNHGRKLVEDILAELAPLERH